MIIFNNLRLNDLFLCEIVLDKVSQNRDFCDLVEEKNVKQTLNSGLNCLPNRLAGVTAQHVNLNVIFNW